MYRESSKFVTNGPLQESSSGYIYTPFGNHCNHRRILCISEFDINSIDNNNILVFLFCPTACKHLAPLPDGPGMIGEGRVMLNQLNKNKNKLKEPDELHTTQADLILAQQAERRRRF